VQAYEAILALTVAACTAINVRTLSRAAGLYRRRRAGRDGVARTVAWMLVRTEFVLLFVQLIFLAVALDRAFTTHPDEPGVWRYTAYGTARTLASVLIAFKVLLNDHDHRRVVAMAEGDDDAAD
jgi:hypothetical protein